MTEQQAKSVKRYVYELCEAVGISVPDSVYPSGYGFLINLDFRSLSVATNFLARFIDASKENNIPVVKVRLEVLLEHVGWDNCSYRLSVAVPANK